MIKETNYFGGECEFTLPEDYINPFVDLIAPNPYESDSIEAIRYQYNEPYRLEDEIARKYHTYPSDFNDGRKKYRAMYKEGKTSGDIAKLKDALSGLYNLALFYVFCYGSGDGNKGYPGFVCTNVNAYLYKNPESLEQLKQFSYEKNGKIKGCMFLSDLDWKHFEHMWGPSDKCLDLRSLLPYFPGIEHYRV